MAAAVACAAFAGLAGCSDDKEEKITVEKQWVINVPPEEFAGQEGVKYCYDLGVTKPGKMLAGVNSQETREWAEAAGITLGEYGFGWNDEPGELPYEVIPKDETSGTIRAKLEDRTSPVYITFTYSELTLTTMKLSAGEGTVPYACEAKKCTLYELYPPR